MKNFEFVLNAMDMIKREDPDIWRRAVPRRVVPPPGYASPLVHACSMAAVLLGHKRPYLKPVAHYGHIQGAVMDIVQHRLAEHLVPTYFVSEELARAAAATQPPESMLLGEVRWPLPALLFAMPMEFTREYAGVRCPFVAMVKAQGGHHPEVDNGIGGVEIEGDRILIHLQVFWNDYGMPVDYTDCTKLSEPVTAVQNFEFTSYQGAPARGRANANDITALELAEYDKDAGVPADRDAELAVTRKMNSLALSLLMIMSARPDLVEAGTETRKARVKRGVERDALWSPNWLGRTYKARREGLGGTHASPRMHWRLGHWRKQPHGPGRTQRRDTWIEGVLVCGLDEKKEGA